MIQQVVARIGADWTPLARRRAVSTCERLVAKAAERYLSNFLKTRRQKFSTYYTWYVAQVVNNADAKNGSLWNAVVKRINDR